MDIMSDEMQEWQHMNKFVPAWDLLYALCLSESEGHVPLRRLYKESSFLPGRQYAEYVKAAESLSTFGYVDSSGRGFSMRIRPTEKGRSFCGRFM